MTVDFKSQKPASSTDFRNLLKNKDLGKGQSTAYLQIVHGGQKFDKKAIVPKPELFGIFIPEECAKAVNFKPSDKWVKSTQYFGAGESATEGYISNDVRLIVIRKNPIMMYDKNSRGLVGEFNKDVYNNHKGSIELKTRLFVMPVDEANNFLADRPIVFTLKGSFAVSFGEQYKAFKLAFDNIIGERRFGEFWSLAVFAFNITPTWKGSPASYLASITSFVKPTGDNLQDLYIFNDAKEAQLLKWYKDTETKAPESVTEEVPVVTEVDDDSEIPATDSKAVALLKQKAAQFADVTEEDDNDIPL